MNALAVSKLDLPLQRLLALAAILGHVPSFAEVVEHFGYAEVKALGRRYGSLTKARALAGALRRVAGRKSK